MAYFVDKHPKWLKWIAAEDFNDTDFIRIIAFFVFHSPCPGLSSMGKMLSDYKWSAPWKLPYYLNRQLKMASTNFNLLFSAKSYDAIEDALGKANLLDDFVTNYSTERICVYDVKQNQFLSVFYHIRNSIAHCRFKMVKDMQDCIFIFEDVQNRTESDKVKVSARMIIRKSTLLKWIDIIESGESIYVQGDEKQ